MTAPSPPPQPPSRSADGQTTAPGVSAVALPALLRSPIATGLVDAEGLVREVNPALCRMLDLDPGDLVGRSLVTLAHPDDASAVIVKLQDLIAGRRDAASLRVRLVARTGEMVHADLALVNVSETGAEIPRVLLQLVDVGTEVANFEVLQKTAHQFRLMAESASDVVYQTDSAGVIRWVSPSVTHVLGWDAGSLVGTHASSLVAPDDLSLLPSRREDLHRRDGEGGSVVVRFRTLRGYHRDMALTARPIEAEDGLPDGAVVGLRDVTDEQSARRTLARSEERFRLAMAAAPHGMAIADADEHFVQVNPALCQLLGVSRSEILGRTIADFLGPDDQAVLSAMRRRLSEDGEDSASHEHHLLSPGRELWVVHAVSVTRDERGVPIFYVHQFVDQTEARRLRADLEYRASRDGLTGVANRPELMARLATQLQTTDAALAGVGVLFVDIDNLKPINDTYGHKGGDDVITAVADRLLAAVRRDDMVARIGGDEFVVVLDGVHNRDEVQRVAEKCRESVCVPVRSRGEQIPVTVSIGAVLASATDTPDHVLVRADEALYKAKTGGRNQVGLG